MKCVKCNSNEICGYIEIIYHGKPYSDTDTKIRKYYCRYHIEESKND